MYEINPFSLRFSGDEERKFQEEYFQKFLKPVRFCLITGIFLYSIFGFLDAWILPEVKFKLWLIRYTIVCAVIIPVFLFTFSRHFKKFMQVTLAFLIVIAGFGIIAMTVVAPPPGNYSYYAGLIIVLIYAHTFCRLRFVYATLASFIIIIAYEIVAIQISHTPFLILVNNNFFFLSANIIGMFACYLIELYVRKEFVQRTLLELEEEKSEKLLLNILPKGIAERLKQANSDAAISFSQVIVDKFPDVTVLFADIVEFTSLSSRISPESLVVFLNELFSIFDDLAEKHRLEKIKTIGDAYMVVGGLPDPLPNHAEAVAEMALDMQEAVANIEAAREGWLRIRIGMHTGSVVAGVIGSKKFSYDLWGNTVNIASRMEHSSVAGNILVSEETYRRLRSSYLFIERGQVEVKGKGTMNTYFLAGRKSADVASPIETRHNTTTETDEARNTISPLR